MRKITKKANYIIIILSILLTLDILHYIKLDEYLTIDFIYLINLLIGISIYNTIKYTYKHA